MYEIFHTLFHIVYVKMAKYRRYRNYNRRNRGRWSANIQEIGTTDIIVPATAGAWSRDFQLAFNPSQSNQSVSQVYTVKNFECTLDLSSSGSTDAPSTIEDITAYIMYVPQGMTITSSYNIQHPEYIMAYKFIGTPTIDGPTTSRAQATRIKTRLSRKLQSGDSIVLFIKGNHTQAGTMTTTLELSGLARWWTKAN